MKVTDGAKIFIKNETLDKYIFVLRDNKPTIPRPNTWSILGGGIEEGETPLEAVLREVKEEFDIDLYDVKKIHTMKIELEVQGELNTVTGHFFLAKTKTEDLSKIPLKEGQKVSYFSLEEITNIESISQNTKKLLYMCENHLKKSEKEKEL